MDTNNFFSFPRIAMVMKREIMENWKTNLYRLIGIYAAFALVMILHNVDNECRGMVLLRYRLLALLF